MSIEVALLVGGTVLMLAFTLLVIAVARIVAWLASLVMPTRQPAWIVGAVDAVGDAFRSRRRPSRLWLDRSERAGSPPVASPRSRSPI